MDFLIFVWLGGVHQTPQRVVVFPVLQVSHNSILILLFAGDESSLLDQREECREWRSKSRSHVDVDTIKVLQIVRWMGVLSL